MINSEQKMAMALSGLVDIQKHLIGEGPRVSLGEKIANDHGVKKFLETGEDFTSIKLSPKEFKTAITSTSTVNDPLATTFRPDVAQGAIGKLQVRDLLSAGVTSESAIEFPIEASYTNSASVQWSGSPGARENVSLAESGATFSTSFVPVTTIGHWITTSKQILQDSSVLQSFLSSRLMYGLKLEEEDQILNGDASDGQLDGLLNNATAYSVPSPVYADGGDTIRDCIEQLQVASYSPDAIIVNPVDWMAIEIAQAGDPRVVPSQPTLWGLPVVVTNTIASGVCLVGDFRRAAALFDREQATIEISRKHDSNMVKNAVTLLAQERTAVVVTNPLALITASI